MTNGNQDLAANSVRDEDDDGVNEGMVVELWRDGVKVAQTNTNAEGHYEFPGLAPGAYEIRFAANSKYLVEPPDANSADGDNEDRSRAVYTNGLIVISYELLSGQGVGSNKGEPLNAGFRGSGALSSDVDVRAYSAEDGVYVEFIAYDVEVDGDIMLFLVTGPGDFDFEYLGVVSVKAGPQYFARFKVPGLVIGEKYDFAIVDEINKYWEAPGVTVGTFAAEMISMTHTGMRLVFSTLVGRTYEVQWTARLGQPWQVLTTLVANGDKTTVVVRPPESPTGFFKFVLKE